MMAIWYSLMYPLAQPWVRKLPPPLITDSPVPLYDERFPGRGGVYFYSGQK